jgi:hypothetical protein
VFNGKAMTNVGKTYLALGIAQALHSMEEMYEHLYDFLWTATGTLPNLIPVLPRIRMESGVFAVLNMAIITVILATVPFVDSNRRWAIPLAWFWAVIEICNGLGHLSATVVFSGYVPGAFSAPLLVAVGAVLLVQLSRRKRKNKGVVFWTAKSCTPGRAGGLIKS